jgi:2-keto-4-pentenoate hydratase
MEDAPVDGTTIDHAALGAELHSARRDRTPVDPLVERFPGFSAVDGYRVQEAFLDRLLAGGDEVRGWKLGLTSRAMQALLGVDSPDYSRVPAGFVVPAGGSVAVADFVAPRIEAEIAVVLDRPLSGPDCTVAEVRAAVGGYLAALEVVDSRIRDWRITLADTVADLASMGAVVLAETAVPPGEWQARLVGMALDADGEVVASGAGAASLGDPLAAIAWLVRTLHPLGASLEAGQFVMTGALHAAVPPARGTTYTAEFDRLGAVSLSVE